MKKYYLIFLLTIFYSSLQAQEAIVKIATNYFRANPFTQEFSDFLDQLMHDPAIANKSLTKRTDTSLFSFMAEYKNHSPYTFLANRTEIKFYEKAVDVGDSTLAIDTVFIYQLIGYSYGKEGAENVKKEFEKFNKRFQKQFFSSQPGDLKKNDEIVGGMINYFILGSTISPLGISWAKLDEFQNAFSILFRIKMEENNAVLPVAPDSR